MSVLTTESPAHAQLLLYKQRVQQILLQTVKLESRIATVSQKIVSKLSNAK
jgi:hypothetical protein